MNTDTENEREDHNEGTRNEAVNALKGTKTDNLDNEVIEMCTIWQEVDQAIYFWYVKYVYRICLHIVLCLIWALLTD